MTPTTTTRQGAWMLAGAVVAAGALAAVLMTGGGDSSAAVERSLAPQPRHAPTPEEATLAAPTLANDTARTVASASQASVDVHTATAPAELCVVEGVLLMPRGFPEPESLLVGAWSLGEDASSAPIVGSPSADSTFRFDDVPTGTWTFVARAEKEGRIAWGRSESVAALPGGHIGGVRVTLQEYVVEGIVTDRAGVPIAGMPVAYGWERLDAFAGRSLEPPVEDSLLDETSTSLDLADLDSSSSSEGPALPPPPGDVAQANPAMEEIVRALESAMRQRATDVAEIGYGRRGETPEPGGIRIQIASSGSSSIAIDGGTFSLGPGSFSTGNIVFSVSPDFNGFRSGRARAESVFTDAAGAFRIALEGPGSVGITAPGVPVEGEREWIPKDESVSVTAEGPSGRVDFELQRAARIEGRVIRSDAEPGSISVFLRPVGGGRTRTETTDEDGMFKFGELSPGRFLMYARNGGSQGQAFSLHLEVDVSEGGTAIIDDVLTPSSSVAGVLRDSAGQPLAAMRVSAIGASNNDLTRSASTDDSGYFEIVGMYACDYVLTVKGRKLIGEHEVTVPPRGARVDVGVLEVE